MYTDHQVCKHDENKDIEPHLCPYRDEINNDQSLCTCCDDCVGVCMDEI